MTDIQIRYFLTAARCLNFTEAAKQLYISQPALSQQIASLEKELNMQLFVRMKKRVYLTPAAVVLLKELPDYEQHYVDIVEKAMLANQGHTQTLKIGITEGQIMPAEWTDKFFSFKVEHPQVGIEIVSGSLGKIHKLLMEGEIDIAYTFDFEVADKTNLVYIDVCKNEGVAFVSKFHPCANMDITNLKQLQHETFIMLNKAESSVLYEMILNDCKRAGFNPNIRFVSSLNENIICTELGFGIGITNKLSYACVNPNIRILENLKIAENQFVFAWKKDNMNTSIPLFIHSVCNHSY